MFKRVLEFFGIYQYCVTFYWYDENDLYVGHVSVMKWARNDTKAIKSATKQVYFSDITLNNFCETYCEQV